MFKGVHHVEYVVQDVSKAKEYMQRVFGMKPLPLDKTVEQYKKMGLKVLLYDVGNVLLYFLEPTREGTVIAKFLKEKGPGLLHVGWTVKNIDKVAKDLVANGAKLRPENVSGAASRYLGYKVVNIDIPDNPLGLWFHLAEGQWKVD